MQLRRRAVCLVFFYSFFFLYNGGDESELTLLLTHRGAFLRTYPLVLCSHVLHYADGGRFRFSRSCFHLPHVLCLDQEQTPSMDFAPYLRFAIAPS